MPIHLSGKKIVRIDAAKLLRGDAVASSAIREGILMEMLRDVDDDAELHITKPSPEDGVAVPSAWLEMLKEHRGRVVFHQVSKPTC